MLKISIFLCFGDKWVGWINACLFYARSSIIVNGSLTEVFQLHRGLSQWDMLSSFLFILAMEGLHVGLECFDNMSL